MTAEDFETADQSIATDVVGKYYISCNMLETMIRLIALMINRHLVDNYFNSDNLIILAVPKRNPYITGQKSRYSVGEVVDLNCTSNASIPEAELSWYVNSVEVSYSQTLLRHSEKVKRTLSDSIFRPMEMHFAAFSIRANISFDFGLRVLESFMQCKSIFRA